MIKTRICTNTENHAAFGIRKRWRGRYSACYILPKHTARSFFYKERMLFSRSGSSRRAAGLQPSLKNVRQKIPPNRQTRL